MVDSLVTIYNSDSISLLSERDFLEPTHFNIIKEYMIPYSWWLLDSIYDEIDGCIVSYITSEGDLDSCNTELGGLEAQPPAGKGAYIRPTITLTL